MLSSMSMTGDYVHPFSRGRMLNVCIIKECAQLFWEKNPGILERSVRTRVFEGFMIGSTDGRHNDRK